MKPTAYLVNAARGGVVNEEALAEALRAKRIAGAALDVYDQEPLPKDHPLRNIPNLILTPHLGASTAEAQQNVAVEIAEAVRAALLEGDLSRAVNAPALSGEALKRVKPLLDLAQRLGLLAAALAEAPIDRVEVRYAGSVEEAMRPLTSAALIGVLTPVVGRGVNFVNAIHIAETRGMAVERARLGPQRGFSELVEVRLFGRKAETTVAGALLAEGHPRIVRLDGFQVDLNPHGTLVILRNRDVPGVIGRVGSIIGDAGTNIAQYHQARMQAGGQALAVISVDSKLDNEVMAKLKQLPEIVDVRQAELD
jgi:D-3-phosphoglycerate dehydrogenase